MKKRNRFIALLGFIFVLSLAFTGVFAVTTAQAEAINPTVFRMQQGVSIRFSAPSGLRFVAEVDEDTVNAVAADENSCFGALIVPYDYFETYNVSTENGTDYVNAFANAGATVQTKDNLTVSSKQSSGFYGVACSITNLNYKNYNREFFGVVYIKTVTEGVADYTYAWCYNDTTVRSADYAAYKYYKILGEDITEEESEMLKTYIANGYLEDGEISEEDLEVAVQNLVADETAFASAVVEYEVEEFNSVMTNIPSSTAGITMYHGEHLSALSELFEELSEDAKTELATEIELYQELKEYYDERYVVAFTTKNSWLRSCTDNNRTASYVIVQDYDQTYGTLSRLNLTLGSGVNPKYFSIDLAISTIKTILQADNSIAEVRFAVSCDNSTNQRINFNNVTDANGSNGFVFLANGVWTEISVSRDEILGSNGRLAAAGAISNLSEINSVYFSLTNFYAVKSGPIVNGVIEQINALPQTVEEVDMYDGEAINSAYESYSAISSDYQSLITNASVLTTIKEYYDSKYVMCYAPETVWLTKQTNASRTASYEIVKGFNETYGSITSLDITTGTEATEKKFYAEISLSKIKEILNADETITEVRFSVSCSKTSAHRIYMNNVKDDGGSGGFRVEANGQWSEVSLSRDEVLGSTGRIYCDDALTASSTIVLSFSNFYAVKTVTDAE